MPSTESSPPATLAASSPASESPPAHAAPRETGTHVPVHAKPGTGLWLLAFAVLVALGLGGGFLWVSHNKSAGENALQNETTAASDAPATVDVVKVEYGPTWHAITLPGECRAWYATTIYARVSGYLKKWNVDIGDRVHEGQVLATIETPELDQQLASGVAKVESDQAQINLAKANIHFSEVTLARYKDAPKGVVSDLERDEKTAEFQRSQAHLTAADSDLHAAQADVDRVRAMIAFQKVTAPFDGTITDRRVDIGDLVTAGSTASTTSLFKLSQADQMRVFVDVPQTLAPTIHDGDKAAAVLREFPGRVFEGRVARNSRSINDVSKTLRVEVDIPNQDLTLLPGMYAEVSFHINDGKPALQIPASAMNFRSGGPQVAIVADDGRVSFKNVTIGRDLGDVIEIAGGLKPHEKVALNISRQVASGDHVKPNPVEPSGAPVPLHTVASTAAIVSHRP